MRAVLTNFGTRGDVQPLVTLGLELRAHGHKVLLALPPSATSVAEQLGLENVAIGPDLRAMQDQINLKMSISADIYDSSDEMLALLSPLRPFFSEVLHQLKGACSKADVLISGAVQPLARIVHELTGIPFVSIQIDNFMGSGGPALCRAGDQLINPFRRSLGLPALKDPLTTGSNSSLLALYAVSTHLLPRPSEWPSHYHLTGFFYQEQKYAIESDPHLSEFIRAGEPPVVVTFGSMVHSDSSAFQRLIEEAIEIVGIRAVVQDLGNHAICDESPLIYRTGFVDHNWLFPQSCCVVQHGGCGTTATLLRSGVPGVFVPHGPCYGQYYWARLAEEAGCAVPAIPLSELTAPALAGAIQQTIQSDPIRKAATILAQNIRMEQGVRGARKMIEQLLYKIGVSYDN
jgi:sterol 3beta-glucosyltransferase